jgi:hypothetical protein
MGGDLEHPRPADGEADVGGTSPGPSRRRRRVLLSTAASGGALLIVAAIVAGATAAGGPQIERVSTSDATTTTSAREAASSTTTTPGLPVLTTAPTSPPVTVPPGARSTLPSTSTSVATRPSTTAQSRPPTGTIEGALVDGRPWTVRHDDVHGLCVTLADDDLGCDDEGPVLGPEADPATPRVAVEGHGFPRDQLGVLVYAYLPPGAADVVLLWNDGRERASGLVVDPAGRFYGIPIRQGDNPDAVSYRDASGREVRRFTLPGHS